MRIVRSIQTKACIDGSILKEYQLDEPLTAPFLAFLSDLGTVRYLDGLKKPYFSFEKEQFISVKGFLGDDTVEVRYPAGFADLLADYFHLLLYYFDQGGQGLAHLRAHEGSIRQKMRVRLGRQDGQGA